MVFLKEFSKKLILKKSAKDEKIMQKYPVGKELSQFFNGYYGIILILSLRDQGSFYIMP